MLNEAYDMVKEFQKEAKQPIGITPHPLSAERLKLRQKWIQDELDEFVNGENVYKQADAIIDLMYYALGALVEMGIKPDELFELVDKYNKKKLLKAQFNEEGKVLKPNGWHHPDDEIKAIIDKM